MFPVVVKNPYKELRDLDYKAYQDAILFSSSLMHNLRSKFAVTDDNLGVLSYVEEEVVKFVLSIKRKG